MMTNRISTLVRGLLLAVTLCSYGLAGPTWLCSITANAAVGDDGTAGPVDFAGVEPATFLRVDTDGKSITLLAPESRRGETTEIGAIKQGDGIWLITGVEDGRAFSMVISDAGYMTLSITGNGTTWSAFGAVLREDEQP